LPSRYSVYAYSSPLATEVSKPVTGTPRSVSIARNASISIFTYSSFNVSNNNRSCSIQAVSLVVSSQVLGCVEAELDDILLHDGSRCEFNFYHCTHKVFQSLYLYLGYISGACYNNHVLFILAESPNTYFTQRRFDLAAPIAAKMPRCGQWQVHARGRDLQGVAGTAIELASFFGGVEGVTDSARHLF